MIDSVHITVNPDSTLLIQVYGVRCRVFEIAGWGIFVSWYDSRYENYPIHIRVAN